MRGVHACVSLFLHLILKCLLCKLILLVLDRYICTFENNLLLIFVHYELINYFIINLLIFLTYF